MYKSSKLLLNLCLSGVVVTLSMIGTTYAGNSTPKLNKSRIELAQVNACAGANPCAGKLGSVGGPLARQLQGKPVVVDVYASWCPACKNIAPTLSQLKQQYGDRIHFIVLDVSNQGAVRESEAKARELGLSEFFAANKSKTGTVTIIDPATGKILANEKNNPNKSFYTQILDVELAKK